MHEGRRQQVINAVHALVCIECRRVWREAGERWRMYITDDDQPEAVPYCNVCAAREFDA
jgi:trehalose utilization protein